MRNAALLLAMATGCTTLFDEPAPEPPEDAGTRYVSAFYGFAVVAPGDPVVRHGKGERGVRGVAFTWDDPDTRTTRHVKLIHTPGNNNLEMTREQLDTAYELARKGIVGNSKTVTEKRIEIAGRPARELDVIALTKDDQLLRCVIHVLITPTRMWQLWYCQPRATYSEAHASAFLDSFELGPSPDSP